MKYMGSKARFAKEILPIILETREEGQTYVEPFAGGMNMIDKVEGRRIASDKHEFLIRMFQALVYEGWSPPEQVTEDFYTEVRKNQERFPKELVGYIGFNSYGGKWFAGYRRDREGKRDYWREHYNNIMKQVPLLEGVDFVCSEYRCLDIPYGSIIYCDPPYAGTTKYRDSFDHACFWEWCREKSKEGHQLFVSEYKAPEDFVSVWQKESKSQLSDQNDKSHKVAMENLFRYRF